MPKEAIITFILSQLILSGPGDVVPKLIGVEISLGAPPCCFLRLAPLKKITKDYIK